MSQLDVESAANAFGIGTTFELGGRTFQMAPVRAEVYGLIERHLETAALNPFEIANENMALFKDPAVKAELLHVAMVQARQKYRATIQEVATYMNTFEGTAFVLWCSIRGDFDEPSKYHCSLEFVKDSLLAMVDDAMKQHRDMGEVLADVHGKLDNVSGEGLVGNSAGPILTGSNGSQTSPDTTTEATTTSESQNSSENRAPTSSPGDESSA